MEPVFVFRLALLLSFAFGCLGLYVASQNKRSIWEGMILGLLFGPLGVLVVALLPPK